MTNKKSLYIDIHAIQTLPPNNINRGELGRPKTAEYGGRTRSYVSSQAWKKAIRDYFGKELNLPVGIRTKHLCELITSGICNLDASIEYENAQNVAKDVLLTVGIKVTKNETGALLFLSHDEISKLAELGKRYHTESPTWKSKKEKTRGKEEYKLRVEKILKDNGLRTIDLALFGRMVAEQQDLGVDAACQVAPAVGVDRNQIEYDFFTAFDDYEGIARMLDNVQFSSSTIYRYASINVSRFLDNLNSDLEKTIRGVQAFIEGFIKSAPKGKTNSFGMPPLPSAVIVQLRDSQPVSLSAAFETPVYVRDSTTDSVTEIACKRLVNQEEALDKSFGVTPIQTYVICTTESTEPLKQLSDNVLSLSEIQQQIEGELQKWNEQ